MPAHFANKPGDVPSCIALALNGRGMNFRKRVPMAFAAVAVMLGADYWIVNRPEPHGVAEFNPVKVSLGRRN